MNPSYDELMAQAISIGILSTARGFNAIVRELKSVFLYEVTKQVEEGSLKRQEAKNIMKAARGESRKR